MPKLDESLYTGEPLPRYHSLDQFRSAQENVRESDRFKPLADARTSANKRGQLNKNKLRPDLHLGWSFGPDGTVPRDRDGHSRMFVIKNDTILEYDGKQLSDGTRLELGSNDFWHQAQMGNVFAYPMGGAKPVQLQPQVGDSLLSFQYSRPLEPKDLSLTTPIRPPQRPNLWKRMVHAVFSSAYKRDFDNYSDQLQKYTDRVEKQQALRNDLSERMERRQQLSQGEKTELVELQKQAAAAERQEMLENQVQQAQARVDRNEISAKFNEGIFEPVPKIYATEETRRDFPGRTVEDSIHNKLFHRQLPSQDGLQKHSYGFYDKNTFQDLTVFDKDKLDLDSITVGNSGQTVTNRQFCAVATFAALDPDIAINTYPLSNEADLSLQPSLENMGFSSRQAKEITASTNSTMHTLDTYIHPPRDGNGRYIKDGIDPARRQTAEAFNAYKNGDLAPLGKLLATGVNMEARQVRDIESPPGQQKSGGLYQSGHLLELMEQDPRLKDAALKAGMDEKNLYLLQGVKTLCDLDKKAAQANLKLAQAAAGGQELSQAEKFACAKDIVKAQIATQNMCLENRSFRSPEMDALEPKMHTDLIPKAGVDYQPGDQKNVRPAPDGKLWAATGVLAFDALKQIYRPPTGSVMQLKTETGKANLDKVAEEIVRQDGLALLGSEELRKKLDFSGEERFDMGVRGLQIMQQKGMLSPKAMEAMNREMKTGVVQKVEESPQAQPKEEQKNVQANPAGIPGLH